MSELSDLKFDEDGKLIESYGNITKLGYLRTWWHFYSYRKSLSVFIGSGEIIIEFLSLLLMIIVFPIMPFIEAWVTYRSAAKFMRKEQKCKSN